MFLFQAYGSARCNLDNYLILQYLQIFAKYRPVGILNEWPFDLLFIFDKSYSFIYKFFYLAILNNSLKKHVLPSQSTAQTY